MGNAEMSVINRMLQDLEKRQANSVTNTSLSGEVRLAIPRERESVISWRWLAIALLSVACGVLGYLYWKQVRLVPVTTHHQSPQPSSLPGISPTMLRAETSLSEPAKPVDDASTRVAEAEKVTVAPTTPPVKDDYHAVPGISLQALDKPKSKPVVVAEKKSPPEQKAELPAMAPSPSHATAANIAGDVKNIKLITPEQKADNDYHRALEVLQQGRIAEAQSMLESVLKQNPKHLGARQALLGIMVENHQSAAAVQLLKSGLSLDPTRVEYAMALARLQVDMNDNGAALGTMQKYLTQGSGRADYQGFLALLLERAGQHKEAARHYEAALRLSPDTAQWWMGLGMSLQGAGDKKGALQAYSQAKQMGTLSPELIGFIDQRIKQLQ